MIFDYPDTTILGAQKTLSQMRSTWLLAILTFPAAAFWWCTICATPSLDLPFWIPLVLTLLWTGFATILSDGRWLRIVLACTFGSTAGMIAGFTIFPTSDIAATHEPLGVAIGTPVIFVIALLPGLIARKISVQRTSVRCVLWALLSCMFVLGPVILALTPPLLTARIKQNDQVAQERFLALRSAAERTAVEARSPDLICDGAAIKRHYSGPPFSDSDWHYIAGNYVREDGYAFGIWCHQQGGYTIDVSPKEPIGYGSRHSCTDETGRTGCGMSPQRPPRETCAPCIP